jgi:hypothetical protein
VTGNNAAFIVDEDRNRPTPLADRRADLIDLLRPGVAGVWDRRSNRAPFNFICWPFWLQNMFSWESLSRRRDISRGNY